MLRKDLKAGETYAAFRSPSGARRWRNSRYSWSYNEPIKVTLVALDGELSDTFTAREIEYEGEKRAGTKDVERTVTTRGILVDLAEPVVADVPDVIGTFYGHDSKAFVPAYTVRSYGSGSYYQTEEIGKHKRTYTQATLENAGCFLMTWAEYEAEIIAREQAKQERAEREKARFQRGIDEDPGKRARLHQLLDALVERGYEVSHQRLGDELPYSIEVSKDGHRRFDIDPQYTAGPKGGRRELLIGTRVDRMTGDDLAELLGI